MRNVLFAIIAATATSTVSASGVECPVNLSNEDMTTCLTVTGSGQSWEDYLAEDAELEAMIKAQAEQEAKEKAKQSLAVGSK